MSDPWELICHHTYSGTPGVVYDRSVGHGSHGEVLGIGASAFVADGAAVGSGAVRIREDGERIYVPPSASWSPLGGLRAELTVRLDSQTAGLALHLGGGPRWLVSGYRFNFAVVGPRLQASFSQAPSPAAPVKPPTWMGPRTGPLKLVKRKKTSWGSDMIRTDLHGLGPNIAVPYDRWVTLAVAHDGFSAIELAIDGVPVARTVPRWPVLPEYGLCIGNTMHVEFPMVGSVDEVRVWRLDPHRIARDFFDRPMDEDARACWEEFLRWLLRWREGNPDCAQELDDRVDALLRDIAAGTTADAEASERFERSRRRYRELWRANEMGGRDMAAVLERAVADLRAVGMADRPAGLRRLLDSECYRRFRAQMPSLDCDPAMAAYLDGRGRGGDGAQ